MLIIARMTANPYLAGILIVEAEVGPARIRKGLVQLLAHGITTMPLSSTAPTTSGWAGTMVVPLIRCVPLKRGIIGLPPIVLAGM